MFQDNVTRDNLYIILLYLPRKHTLDRLMEYQLQQWKVLDHYHPQSVLLYKEVKYIHDIKWILLDDSFWATL